MRKILLSLSMVAFFLVQLSAQNDVGKSDDAARIAITPQVSDQQIPQGAKNMLLNKMKQICAKNGLAGDEGSPFFVMDATVDILSKELTPTAPPMHALNMSINFFIKDATGNVYSQTSLEAKGVGQNETKAYMAGIKRVNVNSGQFKAMVDQGKDKILEFYNSQCDFIISKATALQKQGNDREAIKVLKSVPLISKECYDKCMEILSTIEDTGDSGSSDAVAAGGETDGSAIGSYQVEIDNQIFLVYKNSKMFGNIITLYFEFENRGTEDYELNDYAYDTRIIDENGAEHKVKKLSAGGKDGATTQITILPGVPVKMECEFDKVKQVNLFEYKYNDKIFRLKDIAIVGGTAAMDASGEVAPDGGTAAVQTAPAVNKPFTVGDLVLAVFNNNEDFWHKLYAPAKIMTLANSTTKGECQLISLGEGSSATNWTKDIISKWHVASKEELRDGMVVLYCDEDPTKTTSWRPGVVVMTDELYKDLVSIKGRWKEINKVNYKWVAIIDAPAINAPE